MFLLEGSFSPCNLLSSKTKKLNTLPSLVSSSLCFFFITSSLTLSPPPLSLLLSLCAKLLNHPALACPLPLCVCACVCAPPNPWCSMTLDTWNKTPTNTTHTVPQCMLTHSRLIWHMQWQCSRGCWNHSVRVQPFLATSQNCNPKVTQTDKDPVYIYDYRVTKL